MNAEFDEYIGEYDLGTARELVNAINRFARRADVTTDRIEVSIHDDSGDLSILLRARRPKTQRELAAEVARRVVFDAKIEAQKAARAAK